MIQNLPSAQPSADHGFSGLFPLPLIVTRLSRRQKARERLDKFLLFERLSEYGSVSISVLYIANAIAGDEDEWYAAGGQGVGHGIGMFAR